MAETTIQWTDKVWNPVTGCDKISPGCKHCYAEGVADRFWAKQYPPNPDGSPRKFTDVRCHEDRLDQPLHWKKPARIFVNSMSDLFHEDIPEEFIDRVFAVMALCAEHTFQVLTKRPERMRDYCDRLQQREVPVSLAIVRTPWWESSQASPCATGTIEDRIADGPLPNVWLGVSVENQQYADERLPLLLNTPAAVRWISAEPLLGPVDLHRVADDPQDILQALHYSALQQYHDANVVQAPATLDWVVVGGESGLGARPFHIAWAREIVAQCKSAGVPVFVKQLGAVPVMDEAAWRAAPLRLLSAHNNLKAPTGTVALWMQDSHGGDMEEWPEDLRIREYPLLGVKDLATEELP